jgi:hypothetical protein
MTSAGAGRTSKPDTNKNPPTKRFNIMVGLINKTLHFYRPVDATEEMNTLQKNYPISNLALTRYRITEGWTTGNGFCWTVYARFG